MLLLFNLWHFFLLTSFVFSTKKVERKYGVLPEENMTAVELIRYNGYEPEVHKVKTMDGYILTMQRIPRGKNKTVIANANHDGNFMHNMLRNRTTNKQAVLLQHGLATTSTNWITNLPNESLAFVLADHGYDVWLGNVRGNRYSKEHVNLTIKDPKYWEFSWEEMAEHDLPAMIDYVLDTTGNKQIVYVGHSQGSLMGFAKFSSDQIFAKKVKLFVALAPVSTVHYITSPVRFLAPFSWAIQKMLALIGDYSFGTITWIISYIKPACEFVPEGIMLCENVVFFVAGPESKLMLNQSRIPVYLAHNPDDTSMKNLVHFGQMVTSGKMQKYDYGFFGNLVAYGQTIPPEYYPESLAVDTVVFWSPKDALAGENDVLPLLNKIKNKLKKVVKLSSYSHLDFLWAMDATEKVYIPLIGSIDEFVLQDHAT